MKYSHLTRVSRTATLDTSMHEFDDPLYIRYAYSAHCKTAIAHVPRFEKKGREKSFDFPAGRRSGIFNRHFHSAHESAKRDRLPQTIRSAEKFSFSCCAGMRIPSPTRYPVLWASGPAAALFRLASRTPIGAGMKEAADRSIGLHHPARKLA